MFPTEISLSVIIIIIIIITQFLTRHMSVKVWRKSQAQLLLYHAGQHTAEVWDKAISGICCSVCVCLTVCASILSK